MFVKTNVKAAAFDEDFGIVHDNTAYTYAVSWSDGTGKTLRDFYPDGTKIPYVKVKSIIYDNEDDKKDVYAFFVAFNADADGHYYKLLLVFASKSSFSIDGVYRQPHMSSDSNIDSRNFYKGYCIYYLPISYYVGKNGGVTGFNKDMPLETYDIIYNGYNADIADQGNTKQFIINKIVNFMDGENDDDFSRTDDRGDSSEDGVFDDSIGHFKNVKLKKIHFDQRGQNALPTQATHKIPFFHIYWDSDTSKGKNVDVDNLDYQYKIEFYSLNSDGTKYKSDRSILYYGSDKLHCSTPISNKTNTKTDLWIGSNVEVMRDLYNTVTEGVSYDNTTIQIKKYFWVRPITRNNGVIKFGTWSRVHITDDETFTDSNYDYDSDYSEDDTEANSDDYTPDDSDHNNGRSEDGNDPNSTDDNSNSNDGTSANVNLDSIKNLVNQIGNVPLLIAKIFSFLPSWCLTLIATAFAMFLFLLLIKLIRG